MKFESKEQLRDFILTKGCFDEADNLRIYEKYFREFFQREKELRNIFDFENKKVLYIGSSYGRNLIHFPQGSIGVEVQPRMVKFARSLGLEAISANIEDHIPVESSSFDVIYCRDVLEHMVAPHKILVEFHRILRPDGKLVLDVRNMDGINSKYWDYPEHLYSFNENSIRYLLKRAGFKIKRHIIMNQKLSKIINHVIYENILVNFMPAICVEAEIIPEFNYNKERLEIFSPSWLRKA